MTVGLARCGRWAARMIVGGGWRGGGKGGLVACLRLMSCYICVFVTAPCLIVRLALTTDTTTFYIVGLSLSLGVLHQSAPVTLGCSAANGSLAWVLARACVCNVLLQADTPIAPLTGTRRCRHARPCPSIRPCTRTRTRTRRRPRPSHCQQLGTSRHHPPCHRHTFRTFVY